MKLEQEDVSTHVMPIRIAVADDEPDLRRMLALLLKHLGHEVVCTAANGAELLEQVSDARVDVAVVDFDMPIMDGLATAQELAARGIPVILVSGHPDAEHLVLEYEPVVTCISKPATSEQLQAAIEQAFASVPRRLE